MSDQGVLDKKGALMRASAASPIDIELGCGSRKRHEHAVGIDVIDHPDVDVCGDALQVLSGLPNSSVRDCYSYHFLEHVPDMTSLLQELERVVQIGGTVRVIVPHFSNPYFYSDYTHKQFFGLYSLSYLCHDDVLKRKVPAYRKRFAFSLRHVRLRFKSDRAFPVRRAIKHTCGLLFNLSTWWKEFYEENLCYLFPCYEVEYQLERITAASAQAPRCP